MLDRRSSDFIELIIVFDTGVEAGLRLTLNVEQYEYMAGPHEAAGVKMLLHDPRELPSVHALGQAMPTGTHAFVGVKFTEINNLQAPYGNCKETTLEHTSYYTKEECYTSCLAKLAKRVCGCRNIFMPAVYGGAETCTLEVYLTCLKDLEDNFNAKYAADCQCPVPCEYNIYEPAISYAAISKHALSKLVTSNEKVSLNSKLLLGSETTERMDRIKREELKVLVETFGHRFTDLKRLYEKISYYLSNQSSAALHLHSETNTAFSKIEKLYQFQQYIVERNFLRGREAMEERTLTNVALGFVEFAMLSVKRISQLANVSLNESLVRENNYKLIIDSLTVRQKITQLAKENITALVEAFETGIKIFSYKFEDIDESHTPYIVPKQLLNNSLHNNMYVREFTLRLFNSFDSIYGSLDKLKKVATTAYLNQTINTTALNDASDGYLLACREFMFSKSVFYSHGIDRVVPVIEERKEEIEQIWREFEEKYREIEYNIIALDVSLKTIMTEHIPTLDILVRDLVLYMNSSDKSLMELAYKSVSVDTERAKRAITDFYLAINITGQDIYDSWFVMLDILKSLWAKILHDEDMKAYHEFTNNTRFLQNLTDVLESYSCKCANAGENFAVKKAQQDEDKEFLAVLSDVEDHLANFMESIKIDSTFLRENFLQLDIFFRQLSYDHITQQVAYDFFALICDIGGTLGLFVGASMLTIIEVIDFILSQTPLFFKKQEMKLKYDVS